MPPRRVFVVGVGMSKFVKPKKEGQAGPKYEDFVDRAVTRAFADCGVKPGDVEAAVLGRLNDTAGSGQRALHKCGITEVPIINVANACATGSNAVFLCRQMIQSGANECCLAVGVEEMAPGSLSLPANRSLDWHMDVLGASHGVQDGPKSPPPLPQLFAAAAREHMKKYGSTAEQFAAVGEKNHRHSANNPYSQFRDVYSLEQIVKSRNVAEPITMLQCSPTSDGSAAAIIASEEFVVKHGLQGQAVEIIAQAMSTEDAGSLDKGNIHSESAMNVVGFPMSQRASQKAYAQCGLTAKDAQVIELHDCFSSNEVLTYEAIGLVGLGEGAKYAASGATTFGGAGPVVNPSGGLISKGHPIGATGVAQCCELSWQLRGECGPRQVKDAQVALQHNLGLPGNVVVTMYRAPPEWKGMPKKAATSGAMGFKEDDAEWPAGLQAVKPKKGKL